MPIRHSDLEGLLARSGNRSRSAVDFAMRVLVERQVMRTKAAEVGIAVTPAEIDARVAGFVRTYFGDNRRRYKQQLARQHMTEAQLRVEMQGLILHDRLFAHATANAAPADRDEAYAQWWQGVLADFACRIAYAPGFEPAG